MDFHTYKKLRIEYPKLTATQIFELNEKTENEENDNGTAKEWHSESY